jgi:hypothetical protein
MPRINVCRDTVNRLRAFLSLAEHLEREPMTVDQCAEVLIALGMRSLVEGLWRTQNPDVLIETLQGLANRCPEQVYPFIAEILRTGEAVLQAQENRTPTLGFRSPPDKE